MCIRLLVLEQDASLSCGLTVVLRHLVDDNVDGAIVSLFTNLVALLILLVVDEIINGVIPGLVIRRLLDVMDVRAVLLLLEVVLSIVIEIVLRLAVGEFDVTFDVVSSFRSARGEFATVFYSLMLF